MKTCILILPAIILSWCTVGLAQETFDYKESFPPKLTVQNLASFEISDLAFPIIDDSLLVPNEVGFTYLNNKLVMDVVQDSEEGAYELAAIFQLPDTYSVSGDNYKIHDADLPKVTREGEVSSFMFFKQRMWVKGLIYAAREYTDEEDKRFRVDGFRVVFTTYFDTIRPTVYLYRLRGTSSEPSGTTDSRVEESVKRIERSLEDIEKSVEGVNSDVSDLKASLESIKGELRRLSEKVGS